MRYHTKYANGGALLENSYRLQQSRSSTPATTTDGGQDAGGVNTAHSQRQ